MRLINTVAFDTDGVIAKSDRLHFEVFNEILKRHGFSELSWKTYVHEGFISYDDRRLFAEYLKKYDPLKTGKRRATSDQLVREKEERTSQRLEKEGVEFYNYVRPVTEHLARKRVDMIEVTGSTASETQLYFRNCREIKRRFKVVITATDDLPSKPDPAPYEEGLSRLNRLLGKSIAPNEVVAVEDSVKGVQSAKAAGMFVIGIQNTVRSARELYIAGADLVVKTLNNELFDNLLSLRRPEDLSNASLLGRLARLSCLSDEVNIGTAKEPIFVKRSEWEFRKPPKPVPSKTEMSYLLSLVG